MSKMLQRLILIFLFFQVVPVMGAEKDSTKNVSFAAIPMLNYNNTLGMGFGAMGQMFWRPVKSDTLSPVSSTGVMAFFTTNKSYFVAAFQKFYLQEDRWRITAALGLGSFNYQYWQQIGGLDGLFIEFNTAADFALLRVERKLFGSLYLGANVVYSDNQTAFDIPDFFPDSIRNQRLNMNNAGYLFNYDKRDNQLNPWHGFDIKFENDFYGPFIGSDVHFERYRLIYNHYHFIKEGHILATRIKVAASAGAVPFQGQNVVGGDDLRGYTNGRYRDNQVYAVQAEYRWRVYKKLGVTGFFGLATAVNSIGNITGGPLLPGGGVGLRYMVIPKERINIGIDIAKGKGDWGIYFRIGEAFLR